MNVGHDALPLLRAVPYVHQLRLVVQPDGASVPRDEPVLHREVTLLRDGCRAFVEHLLTLVGVEQLTPQVRVLHPFGRGIPQDRLYLGADEDGGVQVVLPVDVGDGREALHQGAQASLGAVELHVQLSRAIVRFALTREGHLHLGPVDLRGELIHEPRHGLAHQDAQGDDHDGGQRVGGHGKEQEGQAVGEGREGSELQGGPAGERHADPDVHDHEEDGVVVGLGIQRVPHGDEDERQGGERERGASRPALPGSAGHGEADEEGNGAHRARTRTGMPRRGPHECGRERGGAGSHEEDGRRHVSSGCDGASMRGVLCRGGPRTPSFLLCGPLRDQPGTTVGPPEDVFNSRNALSSPAAGGERRPLRWPTATASRTPGDQRVMSVNSVTSTRNT